MALVSGCRALQRSRHWIPNSSAEVDEGINVAKQANAAVSDDPNVLTTAGFVLSFLVGENDAARSAIDRAIVLMRALPKGVTPERVTLIIEGLRRARVSEG